MRVTLYAALALMLQAGINPDAHANPLDIFGFGARAQGLGGAYTAQANDFSANYYNPAGLAAKEGLRLELGYAYHQPMMSINDADVELMPVEGFRGVVVCAPLWDQSSGHRWDCTCRMVW